MAFNDHPTVRAALAKKRVGPAGPLSAERLKEIARRCGADDVGIVEVARPALAPQRSQIDKVFNRTKSLLCYCVRMNREPVRSVARSVANQEFHATYDHANETARKIVRALMDEGIPACNAVAAFPMEVENQARIFTVQHKIVAEQAGIGKMGIHRSVIHPKFGSFILLGTVLLGEEVDAYDHPIDYNPCLGCKLCVAACPVGAIKPDGGFDFQTCYTHNYHDFLANFAEWVETVADAKDRADYRKRVSPTETNAIWQSLSFKPGYKAAYCISVCPAGEDVITPFLENRKQHVEQVVKPLTEAGEILYVIEGSDAAEDAPRKFPHKKVQFVQPARRTMSIPGYLFWLKLGFQRGKAKGLSLRTHFTFEGMGDAKATVLIDGKTLVVEQGHVGDPDLEILSEAEAWLEVIAKDKHIDIALALRQVRVKGGMDKFRSYMACFPQ